MSKILDHHIEKMGRIVTELNSETGYLTVEVMGIIDAKDKQIALLRAQNQKLRDEVLTLQTESAIRHARSK